MTWEPELGELRRREELAREMGGPEKVERQHAQGRLTVRERVAALLDVGTFHEVGALTGRGTYDAEEIVDPRDTRPLLCEWAREAYERLPQELGRSAHGMRP